MERWAGELKIQWDTVIHPAIKSSNKSSTGRSWVGSKCRSTDTAAACGALGWLCTGYRVGMATPASSGCRSIPESQLYLPSPCTSQVLKGSVMGASKRLSLPKITTENREYLSDRACYWKTDLGSYKQEKDIEAYLYFCPWAQRGWKAGGSHRLCAPPVWRCNRHPHTVPQPFLISRGWVGAGNDVWGETTSSVEVKSPAGGWGGLVPDAESLPIFWHVACTAGSSVSEE